MGRAGLREEMISGLLRALPKSIRRELMPFPPKVPRSSASFSRRERRSCKTSPPFFTAATAWR
jgi:hypothetical protein